MDAGVVEDPEERFPLGPHHDVQHVLRKGASSDVRPRKVASSDIRPQNVASSDIWVQICASGPRKAASVDI